MKLYEYLIGGRKAGLRKPDKTFSELKEGDTLYIWVFKKNNDNTIHRIRHSGIFGKPEQKPNGLVYTIQYDGAFVKHNISHNNENNNTDLMTSGNLFNYLTTTYPIDDETAIKLYKKLLK